MRENWKFSETDEFPLAYDWGGAELSRWFVGYSCRWLQLSMFIDFHFRRDEVFAIQVPLLGFTAGVADIFEACEDIERGRGHWAD